MNDNVNRVFNGCDSVVGDHKTNRVNLLYERTTTSHYHRKCAACGLLSSVSTIPETQTACCLHVLFDVGAYMADILL